MWTCSFLKEKRLRVSKKLLRENMSPVFTFLKLYLAQSQLDKIAPTWMNISLQMKTDPDADKTFGWVLEM